MKDGFVWDCYDADAQFLYEEDVIGAHGTYVGPAWSGRTGGSSVRGLLSELVSARLITAAISLMLIINISLLGSWAWLSAQSDPVVNTFVFGALELTLTETDVDGDGDPGANSYPIRPGGSIAKDPVLSVTADTGDCWLFVELRRSEGFDDILEYTVADGWTDFDGTGVIYYRTVGQNSEPQSFGILENDTVTVKSSVTNETLSGLAESAYPTLTVTGYAVLDAEGMDTAADAWSVIAGE